MRSAESGASLIELVAAATLTVVVTATALTIASETIQFATAKADTANTQSTAERAFARTVEVLRKCGLYEEGLDRFPAVIEGGDEIQFVVPVDKDGDGVPLDKLTGEIEWSDTIYRIRLDKETETLAVVDEEDEEVWVLGKSVADVSFVSYLDDPTLNYKEFRVTITSEHVDNRGRTTAHTAFGIVFMRN